MAEMLAPAEKRMLFGLKPKFQFSYKRSHRHKANPCKSSTANDLVFRVLLRQTQLWSVSCIVQDVLAEPPRCADLCLRRVTATLVAVVNADREFPLKGRKSAMVDPRVLQNPSATNSSE